MLALQIHNEINGAEAQQVLQMQRQKDSAEIEQAYSQLPLLGQGNGNTSPPWLSPNKRYPWQVIRPATSSLTSSSTGHATSRSVASPGKIVKPGLMKIEKKKLIYASLQPRSDLVTRANVAGPSTSASVSTTPKSVNLPPIQSIVNKQPTSEIPEQIITLLPKRTSQTDFHVHTFNSFLNLEESLDQWKILPQTDPNLLAVFKSLRSRFFRSISKLNNYNIAWDDGTTLVDLTNFSITIDPNRQILLNRNTLLNCTRANLLSVLFHALIHCSVYESSHARNKDIYAHDANFTEITKFFNNKLDLQIGTDHTFIRGAAENLGSYQCQGKCATRSSFHGIIMVKNHAALPTILSTSSHQQTCGGKFHKVFEISRLNANNNIETRQIVHKIFSDPKIASKTTDAHTAAMSKPRELVDITDDDETHSPKVVAMTTVIDLDDEEFSEHKKKGTRKIVETFKAISDRDFETCPICQTSLNNFGGSLRLHIDLCLGVTISWD